MFVIVFICNKCLLQGNVFFENWEVFTQALKKVYPQDINDPLHSDYKAVIQLLLEYNANSPRPSTLYEVVCNSSIAFRLCYVTQQISCCTSTQKTKLVELIRTD